MKYHRTMQEAFGPYTNRNLHPMGEQEPPGGGYVLAAIACIFCWVGLLAYLWAWR